jgi:ATP-binding cassette subfamily B protein
VVGLAAALETLEVGPGEVIVRQGAPADRFYIVVDGAVDVIRLEEGEERTLARLRRGQFFGEMAILRDIPRTATVKSVRSTTLLAMDRDTFRDLVAQSLTTAETFERLVQQRLDDIARQSREGGPGPL